jgi:arginase
LEAIILTIQLLGFPTTLGLPRTAVQHGPEAMRTAGLIPMLEQLGTTVSDLGDMHLESTTRDEPVDVRLAKVVAAARQQADLWQRTHHNGDLMLTVGGDHTTSLGTIMALAAQGQTFDIVWIDAHGDFNVPESSPTGNPHGMVLSLACGLLPTFMSKVIEPACLHLWGIRDLDSGEKRLLDEAHVEVLDPTQTRAAWDRLIDRLAPNVFISFDIDSIEPVEAPGTGTPVPGGFRTSEGLELVARIAQQRNVLALDVVEFHPDIDQQDLTLNVAMQVVKVAVANRQHM